MIFSDKLYELFEKIKKKVTSKEKRKNKPSLRPIRRNSSNENFKKMKRLEKSEEYLGGKPFNLFLEIKNVLCVFVDKKNDSEVKEIIVFNRNFKENTRHFS